jgi:hypothetical protein
MPFTIILSQYARYPSQLQFFSLLATYYFFMAIREDGISTKFTYLTVIAFLLAYFSWEGAAFLLPSFFVGMLVYKQSDFSWIKNKHAWIAFILISVIVFSQLGARYIYNTLTQLRIGTSRASLSLAPQWIEPAFDPFFYLDNFFLLTNLFPLSFLLGAGLIFCYKCKKFLYLSVVLLFTVFQMTFFLEVVATRYLYHLVPLLLLSGVFIFFEFMDYICLHVSLFSDYMGNFIRGLALITVFLPTNDFIMKPYGTPTLINNDLINKVSYYNLNNNRGIEFLRDQVRPGDVMISSWPHIFEYHLGRCEYFTQNMLRLDIAISYDMVASHRSTGVPMIYTVDDLRELCSAHRRVWILFQTFSENRFEPKFVRFVKHNTRCVYEDFYLAAYLWER